MVSGVSVSGGEGLKIKLKFINSLKKYTYK